MTPSAVNLKTVELVKNLLDARLAELSAQLVPVVMDVVQVMSGSSSTHATSDSPRYALRLDYGFWRLWFDGAEAVLKDEVGLRYVNFAFMHPWQQLQLGAMLGQIPVRRVVMSSIVDPDTGIAIPIGRASVPQERSPALDEREDRKLYQRKLRELRAVAGDSAISALERQEAEEELDQFLKAFKTRQGTKSAFGREIENVRLAIKRLQNGLSIANDKNGNPHRVLRAFAAHLRQHLIKPSRRCSPGYWVYDPPPGVAWSD